MPTAPFNKFDSFVAACANGVHNLATATVKVLLTANLPSRTNTKYSDITGELGTGSGYTLGGANATLISSTQTSGLYALVVNDVVFTATGSMGPFRYVVLYNNSATNKELIGWWDNGSPVTLAATNTFTIDFDNVLGVIQLQ